MRLRIISLMILFCLAISVKAQVTDTLFYDGNWHLTKRSTGVYFRITTIDTLSFHFEGNFVDYHSDGRIIALGSYVDGKKHGIFKRFYNNGVLYRQGEFKNDVQVGLWAVYYSNGTLREKVDLDKSPFTVIEYYDDRGQQAIDAGTGNWEFIFNEASKTYFLEATFEEGMRDGTWQVRDRGGRLMYKEQYKEGQLQKAVKMTYPKFSNKKVISKFNNSMYYAGSLSTTEKFNSINSTREDYPYLRFLPEPTEQPLENNDILASFEGGIAGFYKYIQQNLRYPDEAQKMGLEGKVFVEFVIEKDGSVDNIKILRGIGSGCDQEALRVIRNSPNWTPGENENGETIPQRVVLPITFKLS